jgi:hypothetical protein
VLTSVEKQRGNQRRSAEADGTLIRGNRVRELLIAFSSLTLCERGSRHLACACDPVAFFSFD